jgi:hypothetical protein
MSPFYVKNVPPVERVVRLCAGLAGTVVSVSFLGGWPGWLVGASAVGLAISGIVGFCPACAMFGRKLRS